MVRARSIQPHPIVIASATARRADVGMRIMPINAPGGEHPLGVSILAWAAHVLHHLSVATFLQGAADTAGAVRERLRPRHPPPSSFAPLARPVQGEEHPVRLR